LLIISQPDESESKTEFSGNRKRKYNCCGNVPTDIANVSKNFKSYSGSLSIFLKMDFDIVKIGLLPF
jgi:hypothetical protein